jgi:hypothetical protein
MITFYQSIDSPLYCPACERHNEATPEEVLKGLLDVAEECEHCYEVLDITNNQDGSVCIECEGHEEI